MGTDKTRREKIEWIKNQIEQFFKKKPEGSISKKKLLAQFALNTASTKRTGAEILELLEDTNEIKIQGDFILK